MLKKDFEYSTGLKIEAKGDGGIYFIKRTFQNKVELLSTSDSDNCFILTISNNNVYEMDSDNCIFKRSN